MNQNSGRTWWELHLRKCRGEHLSEAEQKQYDSELNVHDHHEAIQGLETLKELRGKVARAEQQNAHLRKQIAELEKEIQRIERALSQETRMLLGVPE